VTVLPVTLSTTDLTSIKFVQDALKNNLRQKWLLSFATQKNNDVIRFLCSENVTFTVALKNSISVRGQQYEPQE
jgi:hypothetical protein